jgi:DNA-binding response OmpR family regulator
MTNTRRILIVEDDETIAFGIQTFLERKQFIIEYADSLALAKQLILNGINIELILLDMNLPDGSGFELCALVKQQMDIPIIFLTVRDDEKDIVKGLDMGADDYIVKPFQFSVLLSRINAVLRRTASNPPSNHLISCGSITLDKSKTQVFNHEQEVILTVGEYRLLLLLLENKNRTLTRAVLLDKLWDSEGDFVNDNTLTVTMKRLREKLGDHSIIKTIRGIGYRAEDGDE